MMQWLTTRRCELYAQLLTWVHYLVAQFAWAGTHIAQLSVSLPKRGTSNIQHSQNAFAKGCGQRMGSSFALHGNEKKAAVSLNTMLGTFAQAVEQPCMELKSALELRKLIPLTPYKADAWDYELHSAGILDRFVKIPQGLRLGFKIDFPSISNVQTPPNKDLVTEFSVKFNVIIQKN
jgi:hypothetical protein